MRNRVRELRARYRWSQGALAKRCGVSRGTIVSVESEVGNFSAKLMLRISREFNEDPRNVFFLDDHVQDALREQTS